jgi:hypothetical protein
MQPGAQGFQAEGHRSRVHHPARIGIAQHRRPRAGRHGFGKAHPGQPDRDRTARLGHFGNRQAGRQNAMPRAVLAASGSVTAPR